MRCVSILVLAVVACDKPPPSGEKLVPFHASSTTTDTPTTTTTVQTATPSATAPVTVSVPRVPDGPIPDTAELRLERTGCFSGGCAVYAVTLRADGQVTFDGHAYVRVFGAATKKVNAARARALFDRAKANGFFTWDEMYRYPITEHTDVTMTATWGGQTKVVSEYGGCDLPHDAVGIVPGPPHGLCSLEQEIDDVAGTADWTTCKAGGQAVPCPRSKPAH